MKKIILTICMVCIASMAFAQEQTVKTGPQIKFEKELYNFGTIVQGDTVEYTFKFKNIGTEPLKILNARGSCGCTVPSYTKEAIAAGKTGEVFVRFKSAGKRGMQNKTVTLMTNSIDKKPVILTLRGTVDLPKSEGDED